jgi:hypothetical protein
MKPADELRAAALTLRATLPGDLNVTPRLVMTDAETVSGTAFCVDHLLPRDEEHEYSACDNCAVLDCWHPALAELVHVLLLARPPLAAVLESWDGVEISEHHAMPDDFAHALAFARVINGGSRG